MQKTASAGEVLDERYLLLEAIGHGGMSTVFKAQDLRDHGGEVVVKIPLPLFASGVGSWSIFQREEFIGAKLDHPLVLRFHPAAGNRPRGYVVTEYVPGPTLAEVLKQRGTLPEPEALALAAQLCAAIEYLHSVGVVHYDVKPANVIVCADGRIRLIDFGLAHAAVTGRFAAGGAPPAIGTANYVAPEQIRRKRGRPSVDIYAAGAMLYEMLTGRAPFPDDDPFVVASARTLGDPPAPRTLNPGISPQVEEIVLRALRRRPSERYASAAAMRADLEHSDRVAVTGLARRLQPVTRRRRFLRLARYATLVGVLPVAVQVVLFLLLWRFGGKHR